MYSLLLNQSLDSVFRLDPATGDLSVLTPLDYERHPLYTLVLNAFWMDMVSERTYILAHMCSSAPKPCCTCTS